MAIRPTDGWRVGIADEERGVSSGELDPEEAVTASLFPESLLSRTDGARTRVLRPRLPSCHRRPARRGQGKRHGPRWTIPAAESSAVYSACRTKNMKHRKAAPGGLC